MAIRCISRMEFSCLRLVLINLAVLAASFELGSGLVSNDARQTPEGSCEVPVKVVETFNFAADDLRQLKEIHIRHNFKVNNSRITFRC